MSRAATLPRARQKNDEHKNGRVLLIISIRKIIIIQPFRRSYCDCAEKVFCSLFYSLAMEMVAEEETMSTANGQQCEEGGIVIKRKG